MLRAVFVLTSALFLSSCAGGLLLGEGAIAESILVRAAVTEVNLTRVALMRGGVARSAAPRLFVRTSTLDAVLAGGATAVVITEADLINLRSSMRRGSRLGLTAGLIEEHSMMRTGSQLLMQPPENAYGKATPLKLLSPQGSVIATVTRNQSNVIIRNAKGGVVSNSYRSKGVILHFCDGESKKLYGFSIPDTEAGVIMHYTISASSETLALSASKITPEMGIYLGKDKILKGATDDVATVVVLTAANLKSLETPYPSSLFPEEAAKQSIRLEQDLIPDPKPPRNENFKAKRGTWSRNNTQFKLIGFTINQGMVATAQIEVTNTGKNQVRLGLDAVGNQGFQAPPTLAASAQDSSGLVLPCTGGSGIYSVAGFVGLYDSQKIMGDQRGGYEQAGLKRWFDQMNEVDPGEKHIITLKFQLSREEMTGKADMDLNFFIRINFYSVRVNGSGKFSKIELLNSTFEGVVPEKAKE